jgi:hypothetical protein
MIFLTLSVTPLAFPSTITFTSTPEYMDEPGVVSVPFVSELEGEESSWETRATYGAMSGGKMLRFYTADAYHVYGPYDSSDTWGNPEDFTTYSGLTLSGNTSGGNVTLVSSDRVTAVNYDGVISTLIGYNTDISYDSLEAGTELRIYTADTVHVYGPYGDDDWGELVDCGTYAAMVLGLDTPGGMVEVFSGSPVSAVIAVPEPATVVLVGLGCLPLLLRRRKKGTGIFS